MNTVKKLEAVTNKNNPLVKFIRLNSIDHMCNKVYPSVSKDWNEYGYFATINNKDADLVIKYFVEWENITFQKWDTRTDWVQHSEFKKDWWVNKVFARTVTILQETEPTIQDYSLV